MIQAINDQDSPTRRRHWLFWDGECEFCRKCVEWVKARDRDDLFKAVPYQDAPPPPLTPELFERCRKAVQVIDAEGRAYSAGMACAFVLGRIGYPLLGRMMTWPVVKSVVEWGYRRVANNRKLVGRILFGI